ncbi:MAG: ChbG/HpnK family deacetylase, partial [Gammaproteobacteria bacterium]|nr:ChbG/HpnK family deacetylase [Gammaproteobacteria bacterium]
MIVNADDLGINKDRDRGIFEAFKDGIVTSSTMLANGFSFEKAAVKAREIDLPVGIHLNLSEGITLSGPINGL